MKHPLAHINITAPFNLVRSVFFHFSPHVRKYSISTEYIHLCAYVNANCSFELSKGSLIEFYDQGFLALGTERSSFRGWAGRTKIHMRENGKLIFHGMNQIGRGSLIWILENGVIDIAGGGFTAGNNMIIAKERVSIGKNCQIAWGVTISDHDFHRTFTNGVKNTETAPVKIGDGVWIGMNATILKGVEIGDAAIVAAGALVTHNVPAHSIVAGVPARVVKENVEFYG